ncbi:MAG: hypothetical protein FWC89_09585 [Defluviitaleaceae bacterium]|nr:hypothetical protein [Defluviitaleaceae bacterium]
MKKWNATAIVVGAFMVVIVAFVIYVTITRETTEDIGHGDIDLLIPEGAILPEILPPPLIQQYGLASRGFIQSSETRFLSIDTGRLVSDLAPEEDGSINRIIANMSIDLGTTTEIYQFEEFYHQLEELHHKLYEEIELVRMIISEVLAKRTLEETRPQESRREIREEIAHAINEAFDTDLVLSVWFMEFNINQRFVEHQIPFLGGQ